MPISAYERVKIARGGKRPTGADFIDHLFTGFFELHGDRRFADDAAIIGGVAYLDTLPVTVIAIEKGHTARERLQRSFGAPNPEGYRKALRLMQQAEKFNRPVICFVDTQGANCGKGAEERGAGEAIARNLYELSAVRTPIITVMIGEGGSGGALALAVADRVWMLSNAYYSVISPESCASILFKDPKRAPEAAEHLHLTANDLVELGIVEKKIAEPDFADADARRSFMEKLGHSLHRELKALSRLDTDRLLAERTEKYRKIGRYDAYSVAGTGTAPAPHTHRWFSHGK